MILVADSGSTKTDWAASSFLPPLTTGGCNPHFCSDHELFSIFSHVCSQFPEVSAVRFFGAGCGNPQQQERVKGLLINAFHTSDVVVATDMLGACLAASPNKPSIVSILGTGSNICHFDGTTIVHQPPSGGFIIGDFGSASALGKLLLSDYLANRLPLDIKTLLEQTISPDMVISRVYHSSHPNRFLASMAPFVVQHGYDNDYCQSLIERLLERWHTMMLQPIRAMGDNKYLEINVVGGFASAIRSHLDDFCLRRSIPLGIILPRPIISLALLYNP